MKNINIVLLEPEIPQNTGNIARTCAATGAALHLIRPLAFELSDKYLKRAGLDYWQSLDWTVYDNLEDFCLQNQGEFYYLTTKATKPYTDIVYPKKTYLFFGKETKGLPEQLLIQNKQNCLKIPMLGDSRSLNLSNSAAIVLYEVLRQRGFQGLNFKGN